MQIKLLKKYLVFSIIPLGFIVYYLYNIITTETTDNAYIDSDISFISPQASGVIEKIFCKDNELISKGQLLAQIKDNDYKIKEMQAKSVLEAANIELELKKQNIILQTIEIQKLESALKSAKTDFTVVENDLKRNIELKKDNFSSSKTLDMIKSNFDKTKFNLEKTILDLKSANNKLQLLELEKQISVINLEKAKYIYDEANLKLEYTKIVAPISGVIVNLNLKLGNFVREGMPILSIVNNEKNYVKANFKETQSVKITPGMKAEISIDGFPKVKIAGYVRSVYPATGAKFSIIPTDNATGNFTKVVQRIPILIDFITPKELEGKIATGISAYVKIYLK